MIDRSKFLEPTPEYAKQFEGLKPESIKDWFNVDLMWIAKRTDSADSENSEESINGYTNLFDYWCREHGVIYTLEEVKMQFKDYPTSMIDEIMMLLPNELGELIEKRIESNS